MPSDPSISVTQDGHEFTATVTIDAELAAWEKCLVFVTATDAACEPLYTSASRQSKYANRRTSFTFTGLTVYTPGDYKFCASVSREGQDPLLGFTGIFTVK